MIRGILIDLSGVVYIGDEPVAGALEALSRIRRSGLPVRFLTNTTRTPKRGLLRRLSKMGFEIAAEELFTPAQAARELLIERGLTPHLLIHPALEEDFRGLPPLIGGERAVIVGDAADGFTYQALNAAFRELANGAVFLALAKNRTFLDADGSLSLDTGAFVAALEYASGRTATVLGKPSKDFFAEAAREMGVDLNDLAMIGDDVESDVSGALAAGVGHALLVRTGKYAPGAEAAAEPEPTAVVDDIGAAADWILARI
ncbi:TIGR01458 family HAD-type hydrolase [Roseibium aggregatum]|uniref:Phospholysine phosphohistidine inorganic pyrophosphate phosphatase n=1 Tax=Roseibium aggregatum TaxID=187304 RepID=A0A926NYW3_9HYPH|nr:TIGR01458 family HAD-type hydrolase [Roseibium aggregatum]MBD1546841.1 TIGR01458 family HAD-type hydrolase [Roseibium aggregatum]